MPTRDNRRRNSSGGAPLSIAGGWRLAAATALCLPWLAAPAHAQRVTLPSVGTEVPQGSPIPRVITPSLPPVGAGPTLPPAPTPVPQPPNARANVQRVVVEGATAYPEGELTALSGVGPGAAVPLTQIEAGRQAILRRYRSDGYIYTAVQAATDRGTLRYVVVEGHVSDVRLEGDIGPAGTQVLRFLNRLREAQPISVALLERYLLLANDVPGVTVRSVIRPGNQPGALTLIAQVSRNPFSGLLTADNRAFRKTGPEQGLLVLDANSFTEFGERTEVSLYRTFNNTQVFGQASVEGFVGSSGLRIRLYGGSGDTQPSDDLRAIGYDGRTTVFGVSATYPLIRRRQQTLNLYAGFDGSETTITTTTGPGNTSVRSGFDSLRILRLGMDYGLQDLLAGSARPASNAASIRLSQGIPSFGATANGDPQAPRIGERTDFTKVNAEVSRTQTLASFGADTTLSLVGLLAGQASGDVLPPAEKFFLGGPRYNRGFYSGEVSGDSALVASIELQLTQPYTFTAFGVTADTIVQPYAFFDYGETWENQSRDINRRLLSAGGGVRLFLTRFTEFDVEGVGRITRYPQGTGTAASPISPEKSGALYWRVLARF